MTRDEVKRILQDNLASSKISVATDDLRVQEDPYGGFRIAIVSDDFSALSSRERRENSLAGLSEDDLVWVDLLTPEEREWAGTLPEDVGLEELPLWPEALARGNIAGPGAKFPSDLDEDLDPPIVTTFYSLRGGVGRSTALAYTARILAAGGRKVVCVDMDLEAPGLAALFGLENEVEPGCGVVDLLLQLDQGEEPDFASHLLRADSVEDLYLVPAGLPSAEYARKLRFIDPVAWYREERNPLRLLIEGLETKLPFTPDVLLLDARTGITPLSGPLLFDVADIAVVVFFPHPQAQRGTEALVQGLLAARTRRSTEDRLLTPEPRFLVSPIPPGRSSDTQTRYEHRPLEWIADWIASVNEARAGQESFLESEITHFVRYREDLAKSDRILKDSETWRAFQPISEWIERFLTTPGEERAEDSIENRKESLLAELSFATGTAESQEDFLDHFVETQTVREAIDPGIPLILGRKGSGKTAIFRRLSEDPALSSIVVHAPAPLKGERGWLMSVDGFKEIEKLLDRYDADWRHFWVFYSGIAAAQELAGERIPFPAQLGELRMPASESEVLERFEEILRQPRFSLFLKDWLRDLDERISSKENTETAFLLLDGLDTGFGSTPEDRQRRRRAVESLFVGWMELSAELRHLRFKIFLREDIWKRLGFENKSHLYGRSVTLQWRDQATYFKVALKQALGAPAFLDLLRSTPGGERLAVAPRPDDWSSEEVFTAWKLLVGERMKGGKTAFTRNWVWIRLADANEDHAPRHLLQLFHEALAWERKEHVRSSYGRSIIRPRGLIVCLEAVSEQALQALKEEFPELEGLMSRLKRVSRTPFAAEELATQEHLDLAQEVGLLSVYEEIEDRVVKYKIPDIYRLALGMGRRGQA